MDINVVVKKVTKYLFWFSLLNLAVHLEILGYPFDLVHWAAGAAMLAIYMMNFFFLYKSWKVDPSCDNSVTLRIISTINFFVITAQLPILIW